MDMRPALRSSASLVAQAIAAPPAVEDFARALWCAGLLLGIDPKDLNYRLAGIPRPTR